ncbi:unnamed protein product [Discula destructiva]
MGHLLRIAALLGSLKVVLGLNTTAWQSQSIYQVITDRFAKTDGSIDACSDMGVYCGGTWQGIINQLDYIQNMGFTAVWISPIVKNIESSTSLGEAYHGFWTADIYSLNDNFGTQADLIALSDALHARGMYLMVDVAMNFMAFNAESTAVDYAQVTPFNSASYYHDACSIDDSIESTVIDCWEQTSGVSLADLRTEDTDVRTIWKEWITDLVATYNIDGLRLDSTKHVEPDFWEEFLAAAGVFATGEILDGNPSTYPEWIQDVPGFVNYPLYFWLIRAFQSSSATLTELVDGINEMKALLKTSTFSSFLENQDNPRFSSYTTDLTLAKNALTMGMMMDGIPIVYQGQEQWQEFTGTDAPYNREPLWTSEYNSSAELYSYITSLNKIRTLAITNDPTSFIAYQANPIWTSDDAHTSAIKKGDVVFVVTNVGSSGSVGTVSLASSATSYVADTVYVDLLSCDSFTADSAGSISFEVTSAPRIIYPSSKSTNSGICSSQDGSLDLSFLQG